ncbi:hypothetical protein LTR27_006757 [Elasticomyces elasticus]|nr:hypothetical protein LTR27_006757 [Elasticomyces elasticus]
MAAYIEVRATIRQTDSAANRGVHRDDETTICEIGLHVTEVMAAHPANLVKSEEDLVDEARGHQHRHVADGEL